MQFYNNSTDTSVNIGTLGGPNIYDFRSVPLSAPQQDTVFSVSAIPQLAPRYPSTSRTLRQRPPSGGLEYSVFSFPSQQFVQDGQGRIFATGQERYQHFMPPEIFFNFPITFNTQFAQTVVFVETTYTGGVPTQTSIDTGSSVTYVDAYGTLLLPGGLSLECLRVRFVENPPHNYKEFRFATREGALIVISSSSSSPDTGLLQVGIEAFAYIAGGSLVSVEKEGGLPAAYSLSQNYPNPFNPSTTIRFALPKSSFVVLKVFNLLGQELETLVNEKLSAGEFEVNWNANALPSGVYLYRIQAADFIDSKKLVLIK